jgi:hypothetical protein
VHSRENLQGRRRPRGNLDVRRRGSLPSLATPAIQFLRGAMPPLLATRNLFIRTARIVAEGRIQSLGTGLRGNPLIVRYARSAARLKGGKTVGQVRTRMGRWQETGGPVGFLVRHDRQARQSDGGCAGTKCRKVKSRSQSQRLTKQIGSSRWTGRSAQSCTNSCTKLGRTRRSFRVAQSRRSRLRLPLAPPEPRLILILLDSTTRLHKGD